MDQGSGSVLLAVLFIHMLALVKWLRHSRHHIHTYHQQKERNFSCLYDSCRNIVDAVMCCLSPSSGAEDFSQLLGVFPAEPAAGSPFRKCSLQMRTALSKFTFPSWE